MVSSDSDSKDLKAAVAEKGEEDPLQLSLVTNLLFIFVVFL